MTLWYSPSEAFRVLNSAVANGDTITDLDRFAYLLALDTGATFTHHEARETAAVCGIYFTEEGMMLLDNGEDRCFTCLHPSDDHDRRGEGNGACSSCPDGRCHG